MQLNETTSLLEVAPEQHTRRCELAMKAIASMRWPAAACGLRTAATMAQEWAARARYLADWCDAQAKGGLVHSEISPSLEADVQAVLIEPIGQPTIEALEAGLMALANTLGRDRAVRVRQAMNRILAAQVPSISLPLEAILLGAELDGSSLEQGDVT